MLLNYQLLTNEMRLKTHDSKFCAIKDFYFHDTYMDLRYLLVEVEKFFGSHSLLMFRDAISNIDLHLHHLYCKYSLKELEDNKSYELEDKITAGEQAKLVDMLTAASTVPLTGDPALPLFFIQREELKALRNMKVDSPLRSAHRIRHYDVIDQTGDTISKVDDFIIDPENWKLHYLVLLDDDKNGQNNKKPKFLSTQMISKISATEQTISTTVNKKQIESCKAGFIPSPTEEAHRKYLAELYLQCVT